MWRYGRIGSRRPDPAGHLAAGRLATAFVLGDRAAMLRLPALFRQMAAGDYAGMAWLVVRFRRYNTTAMTATTDCASGWDEERLRAARAAAGGTLLRDAASFPLPDICAAMPHRDLGPEFRQPARIDAATLFIAGTMDGRTPPANIERLAPWFPDHRSLVIHGAAHDDDLFLSWPAIVPAVADFLAGRPPGIDRIELPAWRFAGAS